jgi:hypothetical protein
VKWREFASNAGDLAALGQQLFDETGLCLIGTLRRDGSPRISPVEPYIVDGDLMLGMMWRSRKATDLLRDPRLVVHSAQCDREAVKGDFKAYGRAIAADDPSAKRRYGDATEERIDWRPEGDFHLFWVDIETAGFISFGEHRAVMRWTPEGGLQRMPHPDD